MPPSTSPQGLSLASVKNDKYNHILWERWNYAENSGFMLNNSFNTGTTRSASGDVFPPDVEFFNFLIT